MLCSQTLSSASLCFHDVSPPLSITHCIHYNKSLQGSVCTSACVYFCFCNCHFPPLPPSTTINALSPPCAVSISLSLSLSDIHSNDPCLSHAGTMLWIPSKQKNKWRLLCKWIVVGLVQERKGKKMVIFVSSCVFWGVRAERKMEKWIQQEVGKGNRK